MTNLDTSAQMHVTASPNYQNDMNMMNNVSQLSIFELAENHHWWVVLDLINTDYSNLLKRDVHGNTVLFQLIKCFTVTHPSENDPTNAIFLCLHKALKSSAGKCAILMGCIDGLTPLHLCCQSIVPDKVSMLVAISNPKALSIQDNDGDTPLHCAFRCGASEQLQEFLIDLAFREFDLLSSCLNKVDVDGNLPLHVSMQNGSCEIVKLLVEILPVGILSLNRFHQSPLHLASEFQRFDLIPVFLENQACLCLDCIDPLLRIEDCRGRTLILILLDFAGITPKETQGTFKIRNPEALAAIHMLLSALVAAQGVDIDLHLDSAEKANQLLRTAIYLGDRIVPEGYIRYLIEAYPILQMVDVQNGRLPLHDAALVMARHQDKNNGILRRRAENDMIIDPIVQFEKDYMYCQKIETNQGNHLLTEGLRTSIVEIMAIQYPEAACTPDKEGRLPCHLAIMTGAAWDSTLKRLFIPSPQPLKAIEPSTGLPPFAFAASRKLLDSKTQVNLIYNLLQIAPDMIGFTTAGEC